VPEIDVMLLSGAVQLSPLAVNVKFGRAVTDDTLDERMKSLDLKNLPESAVTVKLKLPAARVPTCPIPKKLPPSSA